MKLAIIPYRQSGLRALPASLSPACIPASDQAPHLQRSLGVHGGPSHEAPFLKEEPENDPAIQPLGTYPKELKAKSQRDTQVGSKIARRRKQPRDPPTVGCVNRR